jgi:hypothetical protein
MPLAYLVGLGIPSLDTMLPKGWLTVAMPPLTVAPVSSRMNSRALMPGSPVVADLASGLCPILLDGYPR